MGSEMCIRDRSTVSSEDDGAAPQAAEPMSPAVRWLARLAVVALALRFIVAGFRDKWAPADAVGTALLYVAVGLGLCFVVLTLVDLARRRRQD